MRGVGCKRAGLDPTPPTCASGTKKSYFSLTKALLQLPSKRKLMTDWPPLIFGETAICERSELSPRKTVTNCRCQDVFVT